jgi:transposase
MVAAEQSVNVQRKYREVAPFLHEKARRRWAACEASALGYGGISVVAKATGLSRPAIRRGIRELGNTSEDDGDARIRRPGAGRRRLKVEDPTLQGDLERLIAPVTRGDPMMALQWTSHSTRHLAEALSVGGRKISHQTIGRLLMEMGYSLQRNRKT